MSYCRSEFCITSRRRVIAIRWGNSEFTVQDSIKLYHNSARYVENIRKKLLFLFIYNSQSVCLHFPWHLHNAISIQKWIPKYYTVFRWYTSFSCFNSINVYDWVTGLVVFLLHILDVPSSNPVMCLVFLFNKVLGLLIICVEFNIKARISYDVGRA